jgi:uncharacterized protein (DUF1501 family)
MKRRTFITAAASTAFGLQLSGRLLAAPGDAARFLFVFLRGGYDAASLLVPVSSSFYYESRPNIAIPRPSDAPASALPLSADWGLHPALRDSILPLVQRGQAKFIPFAGTDDLSRSHFETQDSIELGQPPAGHRDFDSGFMNRLAAELHSRDSIAFTDQLPLCFRGTLNVANISLKSVAKSGVDAPMRALLSGMYRNHALATQVEEGFDVRDEVSREMTTMSSEMTAASRNAVSAKGFEGEARRVARLMRDRYRLGFIDIGGWDTHVNQGNATGYLATRLEELGRGLAAFADEMGEPAWQQTVVVVVSEFGRTFRENGNRGTDHGHGSVHWVLGGGLSGSTVAGVQQAVNPSTLFQNRDYPVLNEYRAVLAGLFQRQFGLQASALGRVFPGAAVADLGLL